MNPQVQQQQSRGWIIVLAALFLGACFICVGLPMIYWGANTLSNEILNDVMGTPVAQEGEGIPAPRYIPRPQPTEVPEDVKERVLEIIAGSNQEATGFTPDQALIDITDSVVVRMPGDLTLYRCFPQDYSEGDSSNRGCQEIQVGEGFLWG